MRRASLIAVTTALRSLTDAVEALAVAIESLESEPTNAPDVYTTKGPTPPGRSLDWLRRHVARMPGASRSGGARGRSVVWTISRADYERWLASQSKTTNEENEEKDAKGAQVIDIDAAIKAAGYRPTRPTRRGA